MALVSTGHLHGAVWRDALASVAVTATVGLAIGLMTGLALVQVLALLGLHVETGTGVLLHRMLGG
ncbi:MAG TPA: hypothetical protein VFJ89_01525 [Nocardioides sp.]|jgi:hypothetical protein|nr:hypothetical protein [Nocardioides sp.]